MLLAIIGYNKLKCLANDSYYVSLQEKVEADIPM